LRLVDFIQGENRQIATSNFSSGSDHVIPKSPNPGTHAGIS